MKRSMRPFHYCATPILVEPSPDTGCESHDAWRQRTMEDFRALYTKYAVARMKFVEVCC